MRLILKFMMSPPGKQDLAINILLNISRSKSNLPMKLVHLIKYDMRNIFLEKSYTKYGVEIVSRSFYKTSKSNIPLDTCFYLI